MPRSPVPTAESTNRLKSWREERGLTIRNVSDLTGVSASMLSRVEKGDRQVSPLVKAQIARGLGCRISDLFGTPAPAA